MSNQALSQSPKSYIEINSTTAVVPGQVAVFKLPLGPTYENFYFLHNGNLTLAEMTRIRLKINGQIVQDYESGTDLDLLNRLSDKDNRDYGALLNWPMARNELNTQASRQKTSLATGLTAKGLQVIRTAEIEVQIAPGATNASLKLKAEISASRPPFKIRKVNTRRLQSPGSGVKQWNDLPHTRGDLIARTVWIDDDANSIFNGFELKVNGFSHWKVAIDEQNDMRNQLGLHTSEFVLTFDPSYRGQGTQVLPTLQIQELLYDVDFNMAGTVVEYVETIGNI